MCGPPLAPRLPPAVNARGAQGLSTRPFDDPKILVYIQKRRFGVGKDGDAVGFEFASSRSIRVNDDLMDIPARQLSTDDEVGGDAESWVFFGAGAFAAGKAAAHAAVRRALRHDAPPPTTAAEVGAVKVNSATGSPNSAMSADPAQIDPLTEPVEP